MGRRAKDSRSRRLGRRPKDWIKTEGLSEREQQDATDGLADQRQQDDDANADSH